LKEKEGVLRKGKKGNHLPKLSLGVGGKRGQFVEGLERKNVSWKKRNRKDMKNLLGKVVFD